MFSSNRSEWTEWFYNDISHWNVRNAIDTSYMFAGAEYVDIDLSRWGMSNIESMNYKFANTNSCTGIGFDQWKPSSKVTELIYVFKDSHVYEYSEFYWVWT